MPNFKLNQKGIISSVAILTIGLFALGIAMISLTGAIRETVKNSNNKNGDRAFYIAEAAAGEGAYQYHNKLSTDLYTGGTPELINQVLAGSISVDDNPANWPYVYVTSEARNKNLRKIVRKLNVFPASEAFKYATYSESNIDLGGTSDIYAGNIYANGSINISNNASVNGGEIIEDGDIPPVKIKYNDLAALATESFSLWSGGTGAEDFLQNALTADTHIVYVNDTEIQQTLTDVNLTGSFYPGG